MDTNQQGEVKDSIEGVDDVEDIVGTDDVLVLVHQQEQPALQVDVEDDGPVEPGHLEECEQVLATPAKSFIRALPFNENLS